MAALSPKDIEKAGGDGVEGTVWDSCQPRSRGPRHLSRQPKAPLIIAQMLNIIKAPFYALPKGQSMRPNPLWMSAFLRGFYP